jgi:hypothetical protein
MSLVIIIHSLHGIVNPLPPSSRAPSVIAHLPAVAPSPPFLSPGTPHLHACGRGSLLPRSSPPPHFPCQWRVKALPPWDPWPVAPSTPDRLLLFPSHGQWQGRGRRPIRCAPTTGNAASTESSLLCREPDPKLSAQRRFAESKGSSSRHRKNPRYRRTVPRGNRAASRHRRQLTTQSICAESCRGGPSAQPPPHGAT